MTSSHIKLAAIASFLIAPSAYSATIVAGDVTTTLGPNFFIDDAATGGGDSTVNEPGSANPSRDFGSLNVGAGGSEVTISGIGWATPNWAGTDATSATATITYLGADGTFGGGDDQLIGSVTDNFTFSGAGEMVWAFDSALVATIDGLNSIFRVSIAPSNDTGDGSFRLKTQTGIGPKISVAGTSTAVVPEPSVMMLIGLSSLGLLLRRR